MNSSSRNPRVMRLLVTLGLLMTLFLAIVGDWPGNVHDLLHVAVGQAQAILAPEQDTSATRTLQTSGSPIVDQEQSIYTGALSVRVAASQTMQMGRRGSIVSIDLPLCSPSKNNTIELTVRSMRQNGGSAKATIVFKGTYSDCVWYTFTFIQPLSATAGEAVLLTVVGKQHRAALWGYDGHGGDPYPRGAGAWNGHTINDFAFRAYVQ